MYILLQNRITIKKMILHLMNVKFIIKKMIFSILKKELVLMLC